MAQSVDVPDGDCEHSPQNPLMKFLVFLVEVPSELDDLHHNQEQQVVPVTHAIKSKQIYHLSSKV